MRAPSLEKNMSILIEINQAVSRSLELRDSFQATLQILMNSYKIKSGAIFLSEENGKSVSLIASIGYKVDVAQVRFAVGEGLTGRVAESGKPIVVPQVSKEPLFLNRMASWDPDAGEQSFIGVPIILDYKALGVLIVNFSYNPKRDYENTLQFLTLVASALLQPIRVRHVVESQRQVLLNENVILKRKLQEEYSFHNIIGNSHEMRDVLRASGYGCTDKYHGSAPR